MGRAFEYRKARKMKRWGAMAKTFTKIGREIAMAVKQGGPDPETNPKLRIAIQSAKVANMPKKNVENAITRASSKDAEDLTISFFSSEEISSSIFGLIGEWNPGETFLECSPPNNK